MGRSRGSARRHTGRACLIVLASGLTAGCGASRALPRPASAAPTASATASAARARFIAEADQLCRDGEVRLNAQQHAIDAALQTDQSDDTPANRSALTAALRQDEALATPQLDRLRALTPVAGDRAAVARYLASVASQIQLIEQFATAVEHQDGSALNTIGQELTQGKALLGGLAQAYGFKVCGSQ